MTLSVFVVLLAGTVSFSYADYISPKKQLDSGVLPEDVICRDDRVLVERTNGNVACVYVNAAERLGWKIIENGVTFAPETSNEIIIIEESSIEEKEFKVEKTIEIIPKENTSWIPSATDLSYMDLEKIPNPAGYWVPIPEENREDFAKKFANAAGDVFIEKSDKDEYVTENGKIDFYQKSVYYNLQDLSINDKNEQKEFVSNFMESMGFEYDEQDFTHSIRIAPDINYRGLFISNNVNDIGFAFDGLFDGTLIIFNGWTNNPEIIVFPLSEELAIQMAIDFTLENVEREYALENSEAYHPYHRECNLKMFDNISASKYIISGLPYYNIFTGHCDNGMAAVDGVEDIKIIIDGQTGEEISWRLGYY